MDFCDVVLFLDVRGRNYGRLRFISPLPASGVIFLVCVEWDLSCVGCTLVVEGLLR